MLVLAVLLAACRGDDDRGPEPPPAPSDPAVRIGVSGLGSLDPAQARTIDQMLVADQLFDGLTAPDPATLDPVPAIAASWGAGADFRIWDFTLRSDAIFANGRPVLADDVKYTLERIARPGSGSSVTDLLETVAGYREFAVDGTAADLRGVEVLGPNSVRIVLSESWALLPTVLANPAFGIVPREAVEATDPARPAFAEQPIGSGPFMIAERREDAIDLVPVPGREAGVEQASFVLFDDQVASFAAFEAGDLDWSRVPSESVEDAEAAYGAGAFRPYLAELFYGFNLRNPVFADVRFREAIVRAVDRPAIVDVVYGGTVRAIDGVVVEGLPAHQEDPCGGRCGHDPERSKALLAELFPDGNVPNVDIDFDEDPTQEAVAKAIQANLVEAGIPATLRPKPLAEYQDFAVSGQQGLFRLGWIAPYPSADGILPPLFASASPSNLVGLMDPNIDALFAAARAEPDAAARTARYREAERAVMSLLPVLPLAQFELHGVVSARVEGLEPTVTGTFDLTKVRIPAPAPAD